MKRKIPVRKPPKIVFDKERFGKRLRISVDPYNWIVDYGANCATFGLSKPKYYSSVQNACSGVQGLIIKSLANELNPEKMRNMVDESENYVAEMAGEIKRLFGVTPFPTPERRHELQKQ